MKTIYLFILLLFITNSNAQKFDCVSKIKDYQELFDAKKIAETYEIWSEVVKNCPQENETIYTDGLSILQFKIDNAISAEEKTALVNDKMKLYDLYNKNFPLTTADFEINKAMVLYDNKIESKEEIFRLLNNGFSNAASSCSNANAIYLYFSYCYEKHKEGNKAFSSEFIIEKYMSLDFLLMQWQEKNPKKIQEYKTAQRAIKQLSKDVINCENLTPYYEKNYPANTENPVWIASGLQNLVSKCSTKPIFATMAEKLYALQATPQSCHFMAIAYTKQKRFKEAIQYYNQAAELETNPLEKAKIYYSLATGLANGDKSKSKEYLKNAIKFDPKMGNAYLFLAQLYSENKEVCGTTDFEKKAIFYLAIETAKKAGLANPKLQPTVTKRIAKYAEKSLTQDEIKQAKMNGKSLSIGCWINETISFPSK